MITSNKRFVPVALMHLKFPEEPSVLASHERGEGADGALQTAPDEDVLSSRDKAGFGDISWDVLSEEVCYQVEPVRGATKVSSVVAMIPRHRSEPEASHASRHLFPRVVLRK